MSQFTRPSRRRQVSRQYGMETLELRTMLSATSPDIGPVTDVQGPTNMMIGDTLFIRGSLGDDTIRVVDNGGGSITVFNSAVDNGRGAEFTGVQNVLLRSKRGSDTVDYLITDAGTSVRGIVVCMGPTGNNRFTLNAQAASEVGPDSTIHFTVNGGGDADVVQLNIEDASPDWVIHSNLRGGDDQFSLNVDTPPDNEIIPCVRVNVRGEGDDDRISIDLTGASVDSEILVSGGAGNDFVAVTADSPPEHAFLRIDGGDGNDTIDAVFSLRSENNGFLAIELLGGDGNDNLNLGFEGLGTPAIRRALIDGGAGFDTVTAPSFARVLNSEA
ncbi:MAG: hypothetical protein O3A00_07650 [Planctomycetota bacterium]|nr:hypothetical protein [Planctomycetota bacterium]